MNRHLEACVVIKSTEKSERDNFYLLHLKNERFVDRYKIIHDLYEAHVLSAPLNWELASFVDSLFKVKESYFFPASKYDYEYFHSHCSTEKAIPWFSVELNKKKIGVTYTYGESANYSLLKWIKIADIIEELDSIHLYDEVYSDNKNCPCFECIVQATCFRKQWVRGDDESKFGGEVLKPCPPFNQWKRDRFLKLLNTLPDDIRQLEYDNYKDMH